jgi:redox-sensitive bicupin YhaK (pirin superfamily)
MIEVRRSSERGHFDHGWLNTYHTFSFARYHDPTHMGFRALRVINDDTVAGGRGFAPHPHENMEIFSYVISGQLTHKDSAGHEATTGPGEVQKMTAGRGVVHSEANSGREPVHFLQVWIEPDKADLPPRFEQTRLDPAKLRDRLFAFVTPKGGDGAVSIAADARVYAGVLSRGKAFEQVMAPGRYAWIHIVRGEVAVNGVTLSAGDGAAVSDERSLKFVPAAETELLVFDLA